MPHKNAYIIPTQYYIKLAVTGQISLTICLLQLPVLFYNNTDVNGSTTEILHSHIISTALMTMTLRLPGNLLRLIFTP